VNPRGPCLGTPSARRRACGSRLAAETSARIKCPFALNPVKGGLGLRGSARTGIQRGPTVLLPARSFLVERSSLLCPGRGSGKATPLAAPGSSSSNSDCRTSAQRAAVPLRQRPPKATTSIARTRGAFGLSATRPWPRSAPRTYLRPARLANPPPDCAELLQAHSGPRRCCIIAAMQRARRSRGRRARRGGHIPAARARGARALPGTPGRDGSVWDALGTAYVSRPVRSPDGRNVGAPSAARRRHAVLWVAAPGQPPRPVVPAASLSPQSTAAPRRGRMRLPEVAPVLGGDCEPLRSTTGRSTRQRLVRARPKRPGSQQ